MSAHRTGTNHLIYINVLCAELHVRLSRIKRIVDKYAYRFRGQPQGLPLQCNGRVGNFGNVCPLRHFAERNATSPVLTVEALNRADTRVIPLSGEMSRSDKRVAVVLRTPLQIYIKKSLLQTKRLETGLC